MLLLQMCVLAGCDFLKALPGIGVKKAHANMRRLRSFLRVCACLDMRLLHGFTLNADGINSASLQ